MGRRMSGSAIDAMTLPSSSSTIAWTTLSGWSTTSMRSYGRPYSQCVSTTSYALFTSVAESIVTFGPIRQVGWRSASSAVIEPNVPSARSRNGPPDAVIATRFTRAMSTPLRHCQRAQCSLSTGRSRFPAPPLAARTRWPPTTRTSLFARATSLPAASAARVGRRPAIPGVATSTRSTSSAVASATRSSPPVATRFTPSFVASARTAVVRVRAASAVTIRRSGCAAMTSRACWPIEPVAPRIAARVGPFTRPSSQTRRHGQGGDERRDREQRIDAARHAAVPRQERPRILHLRAPLHPALEEGAGERCRSERDHGDRGLGTAETEERRDAEDRERRGAESAERALPRLARADPRRDLPPAPERADHVRADLGGPRRADREQEPHRESGRRAVRGAPIAELAQEREGGDSDHEHDQLGEGRIAGAAEGPELGERDGRGGREEDEE